MSDETRHKFRDRAYRDGRAFRRRVREWFTRSPNLSKLLSPDIIDIMDVAGGRDDTVNLPVPPDLQNYRLRMQDESVQGLVQGGPPPQPPQDDESENGEGGVAEGDPSAEEGAGDDGASDLPFDDTVTESMPVRQSDILEWLIEDVLELPFLEKLGRQLIEQIQMEQQPRQKSLSLSRLLPREMVREYLKRAVVEAEARQRRNDATETAESVVDIPRDIPFIEWDIVTTTSEEEREPEAEVVLYLLMDKTGSMGGEPLAMLKVFLFFLVELLRWWHGVEKISVVFIRFTSEAEILKEGEEHTFWQTGASGGTEISSGFDKALEHITDTQETEGRRNVYVVCMSDGKNLGENDNDLCIHLVKKLLPLCRQVMYIEIDDDGSRSRGPTIVDHLGRKGHKKTTRLLDALCGDSYLSDHRRFIAELMTSRLDVQNLIRRFFRAEEYLGG